MLAAAASSKHCSSSWRGPKSSWLGDTILDTTIFGRLGSCSLLLTQPPCSSLAVLHITLRGHGTRALSATTLHRIGQGMQRCRCDQIVCIVKMTESRGASVLALPAIAQFIIVHGGRMRPLMVVEADGLALTAVRIIKRLAALDQRIRCYRTQAEFEAACSTSSEEHHRHALSVARLASRRHESGGSLSLQWRGPCSEQFLALSQKLRDSLARLRGGALATGAVLGMHVASGAVLGMHVASGASWAVARVRANSARPIMATLCPPPTPVHVHIDGAWYDLSSFAHPGGTDLIARHNGTDISYLFYSNHFDPLEAARRLRPFKMAKAPNDAPSLLLPTSEPCSDLYLELKRRVTDELARLGVNWRHQFSAAPYAARLACLVACLASRRLGWPGAVSLISALAYGLLTGRQTWTHAHNGVHNPNAIPRPLKRLMALDFVGVVDAWMMEHHAHHAHTNDAAQDPDVRWWMPLFSYADIHASGGSPRTALFAALAYPLLVPVMLVRSLLHAISFDPKGRATVAYVLAVAPLRFGLDIALLGTRYFPLALGAATAYIVGTFVATHQLASNYAPAARKMATTAMEEEEDEDEATRPAMAEPPPVECWMTKQLRATNNVLAGHSAWSAFCGGINNHIEHHLFPMVSSQALSHVVPVVREFARERGLPYQSFTPLELASEHVRFVAGRSPRRRTVRSSRQERTPTMLLRPDSAHDGAMLPSTPVRWSQPLHRRLASLGLASVGLWHLGNSLRPTRTHAAIPSISEYDAVQYKKPKTAAPPPSNAMAGEPLAPAEGLALLNSGLARAAQLLDAGDLEAVRAELHEPAFARFLGFKPGVRGNAANLKPSAGLATAGVSTVALEELLLALKRLDDFCLSNRVLVFNAEDAEQVKRLMAASGTDGGVGGKVDLEEGRALLAEVREQVEVVLRDLGRGV